MTGKKTSCAKNARPHQRRWPTNHTSMFCNLESRAALAGHMLTYTAARWASTCSVDSYGDGELHTRVLYTTHPGVSGLQGSSVTDKTVSQTPWPHQRSPYKANCRATPPSSSAREEPCSPKLHGLIPNHRRSPPPSLRQQAEWHAERHRIRRCGGGAGPDVPDPRGEMVRQREGGSPGSEKTAPMEGGRGGAGCSGGRRWPEFWEVARRRRGGAGVGGGEAVWGY